MIRSHRSHRTLRQCVAVAALALIGAAPALQAATAPALLPRISLRPLTPQEIKDYKLTGLQGASGLSTVGLGQPAYLEVLVNSAVPSANITNVTWALTSQPAGSKAALAASPLGSSVPTYKMVERIDAQVVGRQMLSPDLRGQYTVKATIATTTGTTNVTQTINAGIYMGLNTCALCHSGGQIAENMVDPWSKTHHSTMFTTAIDGTRSDHYGKNCISCHTVGYDANTNAVNGGFDDVATQLNWQFPAVLTNGNWAAMPAALKNLSNIQCENCHGPGSEHAYSLGDTSKISVDIAAGNCAQCHDSKPNHVRSAEWNNSVHAIAVEETEAGCVRCHSGQGFVNYANKAPAVATPYEVITCSACHDPHDATNPHQLRAATSVTLMDNKTTITEGGTGLMCMNCHMTRRDATNYVETTPGSSRFGPHHGPQADMLAGANAITYGKVLPSTAHLKVIEDSCAQCHMQTVASTNVAFTKVGGHTFSMSWAGDGTNGPVHMTAACVECHGDIDSFDFKRQDYDGDGIVDGVQTEVKHLLSNLAYLLPPVGPKDSLNITTNWTKQQLRAAYNYQYVLEDGSFGVHNLSWAVGLLKASIGDLTGDSNRDGLPDAWQIQYFGSVSSPNARPNATPAGDGIPNWLKWSLGMDPTVAGQPFPGGVLLVNGKNIGGSGTSSTNDIAIYTAAEVVFKTEAGKTYQIQAASSASGGWQNLGTPVTGTGQPVSYVTPTRTGVQQYYRVVPQ